MPSRPRVLVLEDEPLIAMMLEEWLAELGYEVVGPARTAAEAMELSRDPSLSAAILDVTVPDGNSLGVAEVLRARAIPFAFATGHGDSKHGAPVLSKPYDFEAFRAMLATRLGVPGLPDSA